MVASFAEVKAEWRRFRHDAPGERFCNHRERMQHRSRSHAAVAVALGVLLLIGGVILLFMPGPGTPLILFGLALVASHSKPIAKRLDRMEPAVHRRGHQMADWWRRLAHAHKATVMVGGLVLATLGLMAIWKWVVVAYLL